MAEVVLHGTQHLSAADLRAMAAYLQSLPPQAPRTMAAKAPDATQRALGASLYDDHCVACHGTQGEGGVTAEGRQVVPALAGNRLVTMDPPTNLVRSIALGGFGPATDGHPRPFGMPPFEQVLDDARIAALATFLRSTWGAQASPLSASDVERYRGGG
jgi:mono/diheme cytochrome c family protein